MLIWGVGYDVVLTNVVLNIWGGKVQCENVVRCWAERCYLVQRGAVQNTRYSTVYRGVYELV